MKGQPAGGLGPKALSRESVGSQAPLWCEWLRRKLTRNPKSEFWAGGFHKVITVQRKRPFPWAWVLSGAALQSQALGPGTPQTGWRGRVLRCRPDRQANGRLCRDGKISDGNTGVGTFPPGLARGPLRQTRETDSLCRPSAGPVPPALLSAHLGLPVSESPSLSHVSPHGSAGRLGVAWTLSRAVSMAGQHTARSGSPEPA